MMAFCAVQPTRRAATYVLWETFNGSATSTLKERLLVTDALILCAQETGIVAADEDDFAAWAADKGWRYVGTPAQSTVGESRRVGAAILVRLELGVRFLAQRRGGGRQVCIWADCHSRTYHVGVPQKRGRCAI